MSKDLDIKQLNSLLQTGLKRLQRYAGFLFLIAILSLYTFLVYQIGSLTQSEPSDEDVAQQSTVKRLRIDQNSIKKIEELEDQNVGVQSLFDTARENPFQE